MTNKLNGNNLSIEPEGNSEVILSDDFDPDIVDREFRRFFSEIPEDDEESRLFYFTKPHVGGKDKMGLFGDFAPSVVLSANRYNGLNLPFRESLLREFGGSKLCHLYCTLDKSVMFNFQNRHMARSKVHNLNSAAMILHRPDLQLSDEHLSSDEISEDEVVKTLFEVKKNATRLLKEIRTDYSETHTIKESKHGLSYPSDLEEIVGKNNLSRILLYGSSASGKGSDYDNFGVIKNLSEDFYERIRGTAPSESGKEVGVIFIPEHVLEKFLYINVSNTLFRKSAKSLKGEFEIPIESSRYQVFKEFYHTGFGSAKLVSGLNLVYRKPDILFDKPGLFEYFMKLNRFTLQGLSQSNGYVTMNKDETLERLRDEFDFEIPEFKPDARHLQKSFLRANRASVEMARKLYNPETAGKSNETLITLENQMTQGIFESQIDQKKVYVFKKEEPLKKGDTALVRVLGEGDESYKSKRSEIYHRGIDTSDNYLVAKRV